MGLPTDSQGGWRGCKPAGRSGGGGLYGISGRAEEGAGGGDGAGGGAGAGGDAAGGAEDEGVLAAAAGDGGDAGQRPQGVVVSAFERLGCLGEQRGEVDPSDSGQGAQDRHVTGLGFLPRRWRLGAGGRPRA